MFKERQKCVVSFYKDFREEEEMQSAVEVKDVRIVVLLKYTQNNNLLYNPKKGQYKEKGRK